MMSPAAAQKILDTAKYDQAVGTRPYSDDERVILKEALRVLDLDRAEIERQRVRAAERERIAAMVAFIETPIPAEAEEVE